jgi:hypothetical protein
VYYEDCRELDQISGNRFTKLENNAINMMQLVLIQKFDEFEVPTQTMKMLGRAVNALTHEDNNLTVSAKVQTYFRCENSISLDPMVKGLIHMMQCRITQDIAHHTMSHILSQCIRHEVLS